MDLSNPVETIVHHLLIGWMNCLDHRDGFPMVSALVYVMYTRLGPRVNYNAKLSIVMIYQVTILHGLSILRGY